MNALGRHIIADFFDGKPEHLNDVVFVEETMVKAAEEAGATLINATFHHFAPFGVSGVVVIQESHLAIHTWPEYGFASVDIFTCGASVDPWISLNYLKQEFEADHVSALEMRRGQLDLLKKTSFKPTSLGVDQLNQERLLTKDLWLTERAGELAFSVHHQGELLHQSTSSYQKIEVLHTKSFGKMLVLDGVIVTTAADEFICHEMAVHVPLFANPKAERVLVVGGGDGGMVKEILKHPHIKEVVLVEIDAEIPKVASRWLPEISYGLHDNRTSLIIMDAYAYLASCDAAAFDVIILDTHDPTHMEHQLSNRQLFYETSRVLAQGGVCITQTGSPWLKQDDFTKMYALLQQQFGEKQVACYQAQIPSFPTGIWTFAICAKGDQLSAMPKKSSNDQLILSSTHYYNFDIHHAAFQLPPYLEKLVSPQMNQRS